MADERGTARPYGTVGSVRNGVRNMPHKIDAYVYSGAISQKISTAIRLAALLITESYSTPHRYARVMSLLGDAIKELESMSDSVTVPLGHSKCLESEFFRSSIYRFMGGGVPVAGTDMFLEWEKTLKDLGKDFLLGETATMIAMKSLREDPDQVHEVSMMILRENGYDVRLNESTAKPEYEITIMPKYSPVIIDGKLAKVLESAV